MMSFYRFLKIFTLISCSFIGLLASISYINALGCQCTVKHLTANSDVEIYSTCNSGIVTTRVTDKTKPSKTIFEMKARMFTLFNHQMAYIDSWNKKDVERTLSSPFYIAFSNSTFLHSSVNRFDGEWIGIHMNSPINLSYMAKIEGYLSLQDRFNLTEK